MKRISIILILCLVLSSTALAEEAPATDFFSGLWNGLVGAVEGAAKDVTNWVNGSGASEWVEQAGKDITNWVDQAGRDVTAWVDQADKDIANWVGQAEKDVNSWVAQNGPAVEAWFNNAGDEVARAWNTIVNPGGYTQQELGQAYRTVAQSMEEAGGLWFAAELPMKVSYDRMREAAVHVESEDPAVISRLVEAVKALKVGQRKDAAASEDADVLTFTFKVGAEYRLEFRGDVWIGPEHRQVEGLEALRALLDNMTH